MAASKIHKEKPLSAAANMCATRSTRTMFLTSCSLLSLAQQHGGFFYQFADAYTTMVNGNKNNRHTHIIQPKNNRKKKVHNKRSKSSHRASGQDEVDGVSTKIKIKVEDEDGNLFPAGALSAQDLLLRERTERGEAAQEEDLAASGEFLESRNQAAPTAQLEQNQKLERQESIVQKLEQLSHDTDLQVHDGQKRTTSRRSTAQQEETAHRIPVDDLQQVDVAGVVGEENDENTRRNQPGDDEISNENHNSRSRNSNEDSSTKTFFQVSELEGKKNKKVHLHDKTNGGPPAAVPDNAARTITAPPGDTSPSSTSSSGDNNKTVLYILGCIAIAVLIAAAFLVYLFFLKPEKDSSAKGGGPDSYMTKLDMLLKEEAEVFANLENIKGIALDPQRPNKLPNPFPLLTVQETSKMIDKFLFAEHQMNTNTMRRNSMTKNTQMNMNQNTKPIFEQDFLPMLSPAQREEPADAYDEIEEELSYEACVAFLCGEECLLSPGGALRIAKFLELRSNSGKNANTGRRDGGAVGTNVPGTATTGAAAAPAAPGGANEEMNNAGGGTNAVVPPPPGTSEGGGPPQTTSNIINPAIKLLPRPSASSLAARQSQQSQMSTTLLSTLSGGETSTYYAVLQLANCDIETLKKDQTSTYYAVLQLANCDIETLKKDLGFPHVTQIAQRVAVNNNNNTVGPAADAVIQLKAQFGFLFSDKNSIVPFRNKLRAWVYVNVKRMEQLKNQKSFVSQQQLFHQEIESLKLTPVEVEMAISMDYLHRVCGFSEFTAVKLAECYFNKNVDFQDLLPLFDNGSYAPGVIPSSVSDEEKRVMDRDLMILKLMTNGEKVSNTRKSKAELLGTAEPRSSESDTPLQLALAAGEITGMIEKLLTTNASQQFGFFKEKIKNKQLAIFLQTAALKFIGTFSPAFSKRIAHQMASSVAPTDESTSTVSKSDYEAMKFWNVLNEQTDPKLFGQGERQRVFHLRKLVLERIFLIKPPSGSLPVSHKAFSAEMENLDKKLQFRALTTQHLMRIMASSGTGPAEVYEMKMKYAATSEMLQRMLVEEMSFSPAFAKSVAKRNSAMVKAMKGSNKSGGRDTSSLNLGIRSNTLLQIENSSDLKQLREMGFFMHTSGAAPTRDSISRKSDMTHISSASRAASDHVKQASTMSRTTSPAALSSPTAIVQTAPGVKVSVTGQEPLQQQQNQNLLPDTTTSDADTEQSGVSSSYNPKEGPSSSKFPQNYTSSAMQLQKKGTLSGEKLSLARDLVAAASTVVVGDNSSATGGVAGAGASSAQNAAGGVASSQQQQGAGTRKTGASNETDDQVIVINPGGPNSSMSSFLEVDFPLAAAQPHAEGEVIEYEHNIVRSSSGDAPAELHVMDLGAFQTLAANGPHNMRYPTSHYATSHMTSQTDSSTEKHSSRRISSSRRSDVSHEEVLLKGGKYTYGPSNETHEGEVLNQLNSEGEIENFPEGEIGTVEGELGHHNRAKELLQRAQQHAGGQKTLQELRKKRDNNPKNLLSSPAANYSSNASAVSSNSNISTDHDKHENETETEKQFRENAEFDFWLWNRVFVQVYRMFDVNRNTIMQIPTGPLGPTDASAWPPIEHGADPTRDAGYRFTRDSGLSRATATPSVALVDKERRSLESGLSAVTSITLNPNIPKSGQIFDLPPPVVADHTDFSRKTNMTQDSTSRRTTSDAGGIRVVSVSMNNAGESNNSGGPGGATSAASSTSKIRPSNQTTLPPQPQAPAERAIYTESLLTGDITNSEKLSFDVKPSQFVSGGTKQKSVAIGGESVINKTSTSTQDNDNKNSNSTVVTSTSRSTDTTSSSRSQILMGQTPTAMHVNTPYATNAVPRTTAGTNSSTTTTPFATQNAAAGTSVVPAGSSSGPTTGTTRNTNPASSSTYNGNNYASMAPPTDRTSGSFLPPGAGQTMLGSLPEQVAVVAAAPAVSTTTASATTRRTSNESTRSTNARAPSAAVNNSYGNKGGKGTGTSYNSYGAGTSSSKKGGKSARRNEGSANSPTYASNYHSPVSSYQYGQQSWGMKSGKGGKDKGKGGFYQ